MLCLLFIVCDNGTGVLAASTSNSYNSLVGKNNGRIVRCLVFTREVNVSLKKNLRKYLSDSKIGNSLFMNDNIIKFNCSTYSGVPNFML